MATTATAGTTSPWYPEGNGTQLPPGGTALLGAGAQVGFGQGVSLDANGQAYLQDGVTPLLLSFGVAWPEKLSEVNAAAGTAKAGVWQGMGAAPNSTVANDGFTAADVGGVPAFWASAITVGRLSNVSGNDRSFAGMAYGLNNDNLVRLWSGPQACAVARTVHALNNDTAGAYGYAVDVSATTDLGSLTGGTALLTAGFFVGRAKRRGVITSVEIVPAATQALALTNYRVIQLWKLDTTGTVALAASPLVATFSTLTQNLTVGQPTQFTLGATSALLMRETDVLVGTSIHTSSGVSMPLSLIRPNFQVI